MLYVNAIKGENNVFEERDLSRNYYTMLKTKYLTIAACDPINPICSGGY